MLPSVSKIIPAYHATNENVLKVKQYILDQFSSSAFNTSSPFPAMDTTPAHIHLKPDATPCATHTPIPILFHWKKEIKESLDADVQKGIIEPVPIGEPVEWCSHMVVIAKKNCKPRGTIDLQKLNAQCYRETHHCQSPFQLACQIPPNMKKTILDALDGFHAIELDEASGKLTTFSTEWGRYHYCHLPHGYLAATDAYTRRYDDIIKGVPNKVKCVDDALLYDHGTEAAFNHTWDYLKLCCDKGIVFNKNKFQFCED